MNNKQVVTIITQGRAYKSGSFLLKMAENIDKTERNVSIITSKKQFKTAVSRNKARRLFKAVIIDSLNNRRPLNKAYLYVFTLNSSVLNMGFNNLAQEFKIFVSKNAIL